MHCAATLARHEPDHLIGMTPAEIDAFVVAIESGWGTGALAESFFPSHGHDAQFRTWWAHYQRASATPRMAARMGRLAVTMDVRGVLGAVNRPTLILHRRQFLFNPIAHGRYLAEHIRGAKLVELDGADGALYTGDIDTAVDEVETWMTGKLRGGAVDEIFATVLFTDIVSSTERASAIGDRQWAQLLEAHDGIVAGVVAAHRGDIIKSTGDGFLCLFDRPSLAVVAACDIRAEVARLGLQIRAGVHAGEVTVRGADVLGLTVHVGARLAERAAANEILVSPIVRALTDGSGLAFAPRGRHELKGCVEELELFSAELSAEALAGGA
jgi:class 3 adenylate cyclase